MSTKLTSGAFDDVLEKMEDCFRMLNAGQGSFVQLLKAELRFFEYAACARDFMKKAMSMQENERRTRRTGAERRKFEAIFGGDCVRISRIRALVEAAYSLDINSRDTRLSTCLTACESLERKLLRLDLGLTLDHEQQRQRDLLQLKKSGFASQDVEEEDATMITLQEEPALFLETKAKQPDSKQAEVTSTLADKGPSKDSLNSASTSASLPQSPQQEFDPLPERQVSHYIVEPTWPSPEESSEADRKLLRRPSWAKARPETDTEMPKRPLRRPSWAKGRSPTDTEQEAFPRCRSPSPLPTLLESARGQRRSKTFDLTLDCVPDTPKLRSLKPTSSSQASGTCSVAPPVRSSSVRGTHESSRMPSTTNPTGTKKIMRPSHSPTSPSQASGTNSMAAPLRSSSRGMQGVSRLPSGSRTPAFPSQSPVAHSQTTGSSSFAPPLRSSRSTSSLTEPNKLMNTRQSPTSLHGSQVLSRMPTVPDLAKSPQSPTSLNGSQVFSRMSTVPDLALLNKVMTAGQPAKYDFGFSRDPPVDFGFTWSSLAWEPQSPLRSLQVPSGAFSPKVPQQFSPYATFRI
mmetsp:Transcript_47028/g.87617  ORF Transcript_47028/g.87617 Transcript_47028/m.87617 type:complete len:573 (+) Transcript_47028:74-1792(+)